MRRAIRLHRLEAPSICRSEGPFTVLDFRARAVATGKGCLSAELIAISIVAGGDALPAGWNGS